MKIVPAIRQRILGIEPSIKVEGTNVLSLVMSLALCAVIVLSLAAGVGLGYVIIFGILDASTAVGRRSRPLRHRFSLPLLAAISQNRGGPPDVSPLDYRNFESALEISGLPPDRHHEVKGR